MIGLVVRPSGVRIVIYTARTNWLLKGIYCKDMILAHLYGALTIMKFHIYSVRNKSPYKMNSNKAPLRSHVLPFTLLYNDF